jgi:uncharacterized protein (TIGR04141 family)
MKLNMTVFLMKEGVKKPKVIEENNKPNHKEINLSNLKADFYWEFKPSKPGWIALFEDVSELSDINFYGVSSRALLIFEIGGRVVCFCFGHSRHLIQPLLIERYFGLKVALNLTDPKLIKSIDKSTISSIPFRSRSQSSKNVSISEFDFKFDWEILKTISGVVERDDDEYEMVTGCDSVSIYTDIEFDEIPDLALRLINASKEERYKEKYPWIDCIVPVRDKSLISKLDSQLIDKICSNSFQEVWLAPPKLIPFEDFSGFAYNRRKKNKSSVQTYPELDLEACLKIKGYYESLDADKVKKTKIFLYNGNKEKLDSWTLYQCLNGEVEIDGEMYLLNDGEWYQINRDFSETVNEYFIKFPRSSLALPNYRGKTEPKYLEYVTTNFNFALLDRKGVKPNTASSSIEFCDLFTEDEELIHVKRYSASATLSHLFSQAYVSAEALLHYEEIVDQVNEHLGGYNGFKLRFNPNTWPRKQKIIFAVMQKRKGDLHFPFFSKVNFKQYSQRLMDMGFKVELLKIDM